jgi:hypothetical protein
VFRLLTDVLIAAVVLSISIVAAITYPEFDEEEHAAEGLTRRAEGDNAKEWAFPVAVWAIIVVAWAAVGVMVLRSIIRVFFAIEARKRR